MKRREENKRADIKAFVTLNAIKNASEHRRSIGTLNMPFAYSALLSHEIFVEDAEAANLSFSCLGRRMGDLVDIQPS